jgi:septal ring factor EnvC (AmiA/AmiB activator)
VSSNALVAYVGPLMAGAGAVGALVRWYVVDRRKSQAEARLTEETTGAEVDVHDTGARDARLLYVQRQVDMERAFHVQQITDRDAEIARQRAELNRRDEVIATLLRDVDRLEGQLARVTRDLNNVRAQLNDISTNPNLRAVHKDEKP